MSEYQRAQLDLERQKLAQQQQPDPTDQTAASLSFENQAAKTGFVIDTIDHAIEQVGSWTAGMMGPALASIPGTPAANLARTIDTIEANVGFDYLQQMRDMSKTGGALGQVSNIELQLLTATLGSLKLSQSPEQLRANLTKLREQLISSKQRLRDAYIEQYGTEPPDAGLFSRERGEAASSPQQGAPEVGTVEDGYRFLGGDPADPNSWQRLQ